MRRLAQRGKACSAWQARRHRAAFLEKALNEGKISFVVRRRNDLGEFIDDDESAEEARDAGVGEASLGSSS